MKFKNTKKKPTHEKKKSPRNSRPIPALTPARLIKIYRVSLKIFIVVIFVFTVVIVALDLQENIEKKQAVDVEREQLTKELKFWKDFISKNDNYRDVYFKLAVLEYKLGNTGNAKMYVEKGLILDPNSENGKKLEKFLSK